MDLKNTVSIVTGGNGGLGSRICHALANEASNIVVVYQNSHTEAEDVVNQMKNLGVKSKSIKCDVSNPSQVNNLVSDVMDTFGQIDILVNDAAFNKWVSFSDLDALTYDLWQKIIDVNLTGPMLCIKSVAEIMKHQGSGRIVNISSNAGLRPSGSSIAYSVSKAGLNQLTRCMAVALAPNILVNCIAPGYLEGTRATSNLDPSYRAKATKEAVLQKAASKDDIAQQVVTFCKTDSVTGQTLVIDCGRFFH